jgi:subtilisin family serine protease
MWDAAHETARREQAYVEPDVGRQWEYQNRVKGSFGAAPGELCQYNDQSGDFPRGDGFAWHLNKSELRIARKQVQQNPARVRIGILDTGFDFNHNTFPQNVLTALQRNFVDDGHPGNDASDPYDRGIFKNPGHGTGTIGLLAGKLLANMALAEQNGDYLGGAPLAEILPVRISPGVVLVYTSAFAAGLDYLIAPGGDPAQRVDVLSMSMGGVGSQAWADVVNRAYDAGIVMVTAAGNNFPGTPESIVYPARFRRVIAACGVMAKGEPYIRANVPFGKMAGNYGPPSKMTTALAAWTPNTAWAEINCKAIVDMDGAGTSSATPQIAAAAALYLQKYKNQMAHFQPFERVEAVRKALFEAADSSSSDSQKYFGRGILQAAKALARAPEPGLHITPPDTADLGFWKVVFGRGVAPSLADLPEHQTTMLGVEVAQLFQIDPDVARSMEDPDVATEAPQSFFDTVLGSPYASKTLKNALSDHKRSAAVPGGYPPRNLPERPRNIVVEPPMPIVRRLRSYAIDPSFSTRPRTVAINEVTVPVRWETDLEPGPAGEYVEVIDHDPASGCFYQPVDLNDPRLLAADGVALQPSDPRFHQQMVYAVSMRTIENFEKALGRKALWSPAMREESAADDRYVRKLRIYPHALRARNAYYDPQKKALLFGYFPALGSRPEEMYPNGIVFTCLSHDIVAHETTHALLDGMHRNLSAEGTVDDLAFHEAFADIVALFQHFSLPEVLRAEMARTRGSFEVPSLLAEIGQEFGYAIGLHKALRSAIGRKPDPALIDRCNEPHDRGSILVAAVFGAFTDIYTRRSEDLIRIATGGTGILSPGEAPQDLVGRLADEARKTAKHVLTMCIRALDYCPPVDLTFGDYLRAIITADFDVVPEDPLAYRIAFADSFRRWGIYPQHLQSLTPTALRWRPPQFSESQNILKSALAIAREFTGNVRYLSQLSHYEPGHPVPDSTPIRERLFVFSRVWREKLHTSLTETIRKLSENERLKLGLDLGLDFSTGREHFEVHALRISEKIGPDNTVKCSLILQILQSRKESIDGAPVRFSGGTTLVVDEEYLDVKYSILKSVGNTGRLQELSKSLARSSTLRQIYFSGSALTDGGQRFAILHSAEEN